MDDFQKGDAVSWSWGNGEGKGKVVERYTSDITKKIKGSDVKRKASEEEPAFLVEQEDGDQVLKSGSELSPA